MKSMSLDKMINKSKDSRVSLITEGNPDLPFSFIQDILDAEEERKAGLGVPFEPKVRR